MSEDARPEPDRLEGAPHPREAVTVFGQDLAQAAFLDAVGQDRMHHAWLIAGPRGVGKATLAWRIARFLLATPPQDSDGLFGAPPPPTTLDIDAEHPVARRLAAGSEPRLCLIRRPWDEKAKRLKTRITIDEVRRLKMFFAMSAADGGRRVVILDAADEMNEAAANALLKMLEEPPRDAVILMVAHQPSRLLPTIRSRCRTLRCVPLGPEDMAQALSLDRIDPALTELAGGSAGLAHSMTRLEGVATYQSLLGLFEDLPLAFDRPGAMKLAESAVGRSAEARYEMLLDLMDRFLSRLALAGAGHAPRVEVRSGEAEILAKLSSGPAAARLWSDLQLDLAERGRRARAVNLDPASVILDMTLKIRETAARTAA